MTAVPPSQPPPMGDAAQSVAVPSLMARSRQSASVRAPTRERVSEAIALVRARQTSMAKEDVPKVSDISELKNLRSTGGIKISTSSGSSKKSNPPFTSTSTSTSTEVMRSPLTPAGQTGFPEKSFQHRPKHPAAKPNSFFQNVFASRSDVANTSQPDEQSLPNQPSSHDEPEENLPGSTNSSGFVNPLELVKREFQLATQSASRGRKATKSKKKSKAKSTTASASITSTTLSAQSSTVVSAPSLGQDGSSDSDEAPVDAKTISDVAKFLDALKISELDNANSPMEQVGSADSDPIEAMRQNESDDFIYGGSDDDDDDDDLSEDSSTGSVNLETLAEIGAFIDAVSKAGSSTASTSTSTSTSLPLKFDAQSEAEIGAFIDALHPDSTSVLEDNTIETQSLCTAPETDVYDTFDTVHETTTPGNTQQYDAYKTKQDAPTFSDPNIADTDVRMNVAKESVAKKRVTIVEPFKEEIAFEELELLQVTSSGSCEIKAQTRVSQPSPIYEQVEAKSLPQGARKDPPAVLTARNASQSDPPPDNLLNEAIMQMHEAQTVAPSYSAESLESGNLTVDRPMVEEEKKFVDGELLQEASLSKDGTIEGLAHRAEVNPAKEETNTLIGGVQGGAPESGELPKQDESEESSMLGQDSQDYDEILSEALGRSEENEIHLLNDNLPSQTQSEQPTDEISEIGAEELLDDAGVPIRAQLVADSSGSEDGGASEMVGRYELLEADKCDDAATYTAQKVRDDSDDNSDDESRLEVNDKLGELRSAGMQNLPNSPSMQDDDSMPWDLKDIASEETMKAAGRTRAEVLNPASRSKARQLISLLSDDSSVPYSLGMSRVESSEQVSEREAEEASDCDAVTAATKSLQQPELKRDDVVVDEIDGGVEVVETSLVEESEEESPALEIPGVPSGDESDSVNDPSGRIERIIETTKEEQEENKPDPETNDVVSLDIVDAFLDMVTGAEPALPDVLSSSGEPEPIVVINCEEMQDWDDSEAIADFLEGKKPPKEVEIEPQPSTENRAEESVDGPGFLEQFESLEVEENEEETHNTELVRGLVIDTKDEAIDHPVIKSPLNLLSPTGIAKFFAALDEEYDGKSQKKRKQIMAFQRVIAPVVSGKKPTIIESAQIRQAAMRAAIPLEVVDRFLDFAAEDETALRDILSSHSEAASLANYEDMEDLNEDEAIAAFLTRFGTLHQGGHFPNADIDAVQAFVGQETGSTEEAVEVDATYGFVNKDLVIQNSDPEEDEQEWWKQGQQETKLATQRGEPRSFESESEELGESRGRSSTGKAMKIEANTSDPDLIDLTEEGLGNQRWVQEEACVVNKKYSASYDVEDTYEWSRKQGIANQGSGWESHKKWLSPKTASALNGPSAIDGVAAVENLNRFIYSKKIFENLQPWKRLYKERTKFHPGFFDVQVNSIYESTTVHTLHDEQDFRPWEHREVEQRFLHEKSFSFSRNWFGDLVKKKGNEKLKMPVCKPKSMEMPIENVPDPGEWTEEWFTQWKTPFGTLSASKSEEYTTDASYTEAGTFTDNGGSYTERGSTTDGASYTEGSATRPRYDESSYSDSGSERSENDEDSWEEAPECGEIINVKLKIGERVTRVHPDFTSSLRRSRWRKKYFPRGTFPY